MRRQSQEFIRSLKSDFLEEPHAADVKNTMPQLEQRAESSSFTSTSTKPRRSTFSLALPWKPSSNHSNYTIDPQNPTNHASSSNSQFKPSKSQRRFVASFPELGDLFSTPVECCSSCLATPPHTPPDAPQLSYPSVSSSSPTGTLSAERISSTSMEEVCQGHLNDYICALERDNLCQGTLYVTATHLCFYSENSGKVVRVIINNSDLVSVEREVGLFAHSIKIRARPLSHTVMASQSSAMSQEDRLARKDYVLTNFVNYEQAVMEIERSWMSFRQGGGSQLVEPESFIAESMSSGRSRQESTRERRRLTRAQSLVEGSAYSSSSIVGRLEASARSLASRYNGTILNTIDDEKIIYSLSRPTSQFGESMSASSLEPPVTRELQNQRYPKSNRRPSKYLPASSPDDSFERTGAEPSMIPLNNTGDYDVSFNQTLAAPIPIQVSSSSSSLRGYKFKSPTPPPSLLSPSLTTTKVSRSSSTVHGAVGKGISPGMIVHVRTGSEGGEFDENTGNRVDAPGKLVLQNRSASEELLPMLSRASSPNGCHTSLPLIRSETTQDPSAPVLCGCERHYQNAILSTVVPIPLELCFELLFSGQGAGQGDTLTCEAHRRINGSSDVGITAWTADNFDDSITSSTEWEKQKRQLEYSVLFKVPMLTKTSTLCLETQEVLQHSANIIRIQSESKIPNVPYGEQFSTLDQICMTWDSPGNTRIKCFTEVKFKRSIMLSSKVEAASLEVFSGFYRELIRQLVEATETRSSMVVRPILPVAASSEALIRSPNTSSDSAIYFKVDDFNSGNSGTTMSTSPLTHRRPSGISAAQSLLSQQYLKSPPTISRHPRVSASSASTATEFTLPGRTSRRITGLALKGRKSTATDVLKSIDLPTLSPAESPVLGHQDLTESKGIAVDSKAKESGTKAIDLWSEFMRKSLAIFNKTNAHESHSKSATDKTSRECTASCGNAELDSSTLESEPSVPGEPTNVPMDKGGPPCLSEIEWSALDNMASHKLEKPHTKPRSISCIVIWTFALGLIISILNAWRLVNTVSSVAQIMQARNDQVSDAAEHPQYNAFGGSMILRHLEKQAYLVPLQIQTEMLRAEIMELKELLEAQRKLKQLSSRSHITEIP